ncbi:MAG: hypothetical protein MZU91_00720 [Desulfosudis oleivorans]|nr:hypothetical protein [Desulfosudis oleivorans]
MTHSTPRRSKRSLILSGGFRHSGPAHPMLQASVVELPAESVQIVERRENLLGQRRRRALSN